MENNRNSFYGVLLGLFIVSLICIGFFWAQLSPLTTTKFNISQQQIQLIIDEHQQNLKVNQQQQQQEEKQQIKQFVTLKCEVIN